MQFERSETLTALAPAMVKVQAEMTKVKKDASNPFFRSKYADLPACWETIGPVLSANGFSVIQVGADTGNEDGRIRQTTILLHESGEYIAGTTSMKPAKDDPQGVGSVMTYIRRYGLMAITGLVADEDDDGNAASRQPQKRQGATKTSAPAKQETPVDRARKLFDKYRDLGMDDVAILDLFQAVTGKEPGAYTDDDVKKVEEDYASRRD